MGAKGEELRERVRECYAGAAGTVQGNAGASCCGSAGEQGLDSEVVGVDWTGGGYSAEELGALPEAAGAASLGCGNPTALATLSPGELVLDLGSYEERLHAFRNVRDEIRTRIESELAGV